MQKSSCAVEYSMSPGEKRAWRISSVQDATGKMLRQMSTESGFAGAGQPRHDHDHD
jgi:hypothetical protein